MKQFILITLAALSFTSVSQAEDIFKAYGEVTTMGVRGTLIVPLSPTFTTAHIIDELDREVIVQAKDDAIYFMATEGEVKGAALEQALNLIREKNPSEPFTDAQLVEYILSVQ